MGTIHLGMVKLKGNWQVIPEQLFPVLAPNHKGIVENTAVHADCAIDLRIHNGGGSDHHTVL